MAERIGIPHYVLDYESRFKEAVIDRFAESYIAGETPVPCVECNMSIKFHDLLGHRARAGRRGAGDRPLRRLARVCPAAAARSIRAREEERDQSYFLFGTTREQLDILRFPLGERASPRRATSRANSGWPVADKHDSQDICFVPDRALCGRDRAAQAGRGGSRDQIVDLDGRVLGTHSGIIHFTIGQRRGLGVAAGAPLYVVRLDAEHRRVVVGPRDALRTSRIVLRDVNWIGEGSIEEALADDRREVFVEGALEPPAAGRLADGARMTATKSNWWTARRAFRPARPASSMTPATARRACSVAASSGARWRQVTARAPPTNPWRRLPRAIKLALMRADISNSSVERAYARWAPVYDLVFGAVFEHGRRATIAAAERIGGRILEVGVGTGISLPAYARCNRLVGVDLSEPMLRKAQERVAELKLDNVDALAVMDAERLALPDKSFDVVVAQYVITAVPHPEATLDEFARVIRPGGEIVLVNHIGAESGARRLFEIGFAPLARRLGWRPEFPFARLADWAARHGGVRMIERRPMPPLGHFSLIRFERLGAVG